MGHIVTFPSDFTQVLQTNKQFHFLHEQADPSVQQLTRTDNNTDCNDQIACKQ